MAATFGTPISAVLLAIELLLFEFQASLLYPGRSRDNTVAAALRIHFIGSEAVFRMPVLTEPSTTELVIYLLEGVLMGVFSVGITKAVYWTEDMFEHLPIHWMWWPAVGGLAVGVIRVFSPHTLGVGYDNIELLLSGTFDGKALFFFCLMKFISWSIALGSGTSGGTLAPIFTIGGGVGALR